MEKKQLFRILAKADRDILIAFANKIEQEGTIRILKEPERTLTMIKLREPVRNSFFYLGEVMVTEAIVELDQVKGMAVTMGSDYEKTLAMAVIDCGFNSRLPVMDCVERELLHLEQAQIKKEEEENAMYLKTMVSFQTMAGGEQ